MTIGSKIKPNTATHAADQTALRWNKTAMFFGQIKFTCEIRNSGSHCHLELRCGEIEKAALL